MINESDENANPVSDDQTTANPAVGDQAAGKAGGVELKKRQLLKTLAKGAFLVPATLMVLARKAAAASQPTS